MKIKPLFVVAFVIFFTSLNFNSAKGQLLNRIKKEVKNRAENKIVNKAGNATDNAIDNAAKGNSNGNTSTNRAATVSNNPAPQQEPEIAKAIAPTVTNYASYDFVPGDKIIFQPDLSDEPDAELPARFSIVKGNAEIQTHEGEKILHLNKGGTVIVMPLMNNTNYLPEQFTLEFDMMYENDKKIFDQLNDFSVRFFIESDEQYSGFGLSYFTIRSNESIILGDRSSGQNRVDQVTQNALTTNNAWHHIALYVRKNIAKAYIGATRVSATNNFPLGASKMAFVTDGRYGFKIKNVRLAAGGDDKYKKVITDGKFITHGILFDVNRSTIKDESMGTLNEIVKMMNQYSDLKFEINGHTDSDGKPESNLKLSEERAKSVKQKLVQLGIAEDRLSTKGFGATKPIDSNDTAEGKANNRRVEFIKI